MLCEWVVPVQDSQASDYLLLNTEARTDQPSDRQTCPHAGRQRTTFDSDGGGDDYALAHRCRRAVEQQHSLRRQQAGSVSSEWAGGDVARAGAEGLDPGGWSRGGRGGGLMRLARGLNPASPPAAALPPRSGSGALGLGRGALWLGVDEGTCGRWSGGWNQQRVRFCPAEPSAIF